MIIDNLKEEDLPQVLEIDRLSFPVAENEDFFKKEDKIYLVARVKGRVAGFLVGKKVLDEMHILRFAVHPDFRRQGAGRRLLEEALKEGRKFYLETRKSNLASKNLCESLGFKVTGERKTYYSDNGEDALTMSLISLPAAFSTFSSKST